MKEFTDKVAVVTGAAHGIGYGIAEKCLQEGMKVVLAGINLDNLVQAEKALSSSGAKTLCVQTDVSKGSDMKDLAKKTLEAFGGVHLLVNNAGVFALGSVWESTIDDWQWVMSVNLWGVIYGVQEFVPIMLEQNTNCHIVNISSLAGLLPSHSSATYQVTKHAVVALTESLYYSLVQRDKKIRASVVCPGYVKTHIMDADRNRPDELKNKGRPVPPAYEEILEQGRQLVEAGMSIEEVAEITFQGIRNEQLYVLTHPEWNVEVGKRFDNILNQHNPFDGAG
jgi:NAD(P)-dependent dehydrogenase (short-subunit alcohol dehydrogenase family)